MDTSVNEPGPWSCAVTLMLDLQRRTQTVSQNAFSETQRQPQRT